MRYIIIIWHQDGGNTENKVYYVWADENDVAYTFDSKVDAKIAWKNSGFNTIHAATIIEVTAQNREWI